VTISVLHVNFSRSGGAGEVAKTLHEEQVRQGTKSLFYAVIDSSLRHRPLLAPLHTLAAGLDHYVIKQPDFAAPISLVRDRSRAPFPDLAGASVLHLHGINGALPLDALERLPRSHKVVWTLHDMNPFTGACHYSLGCERFTSHCHECPAVRQPLRKAIERAHSAKMRVLAGLENLTVVCPSTWLANQARQSSVFKSHNIVMQPNPVGAGFFAPPLTSLAHDSREFSVVAVASSLDDPVKNIPLLTEVFAREFAGRTNASLTLVGKGGAHFEADNITVAGALSRGDLRQLLGTSDVLVVPSLAENAPLVIGEAASQGCVSLVSDVGGMPEQVKALGAGEVFAGPDRLAQLLRAQSQVPPSKRRQTRKRLRKNTEALLSPAAVAAEYAKLYSS